MAIHPTPYSSNKRGRQNVTKSREMNQRKMRISLLSQVRARGSQLLQEAK
ncbi:hypothetical protein HPP92_028672 [Vanilla planifolia]|uniref:Uncharacterized protein n=1 Tax=Vanilla planifolia TaxID=51239 RepID=A0A835P6H1_VANPL|nr:hypothetical protein HPP92_028672 [Vanilla planifolia]